MGTASPFGYFWDNLPKHDKRLTHWVPSLRRTLQENRATPPARILALLSVELIDVFTFAQEGLVTIPDAPPHRVDGVYCVECDGPAYRSLRRLLGVPEQVFMGKIQDIVLFEDDDTTRGLEEPEDVLERLTELEFVDFNEPESERLRRTYNRLRLKYDLLMLRTRFPFDFINLDFCGKYYPQPPNVEQIHRSVGRVLEWQGAKREWSTFSLAVTSRHGPERMPREARRRLTMAAATNMAETPEYREALASYKSVGDGRNLAEWRDSEALDFFCSVWPKAVLELGAQQGWRPEIEHVTCYARRGGYTMVSGVFRFSRTRRSPAGLAAERAHEVTRILDPTERPPIPDHDPDSPRGRELAADLTAAWELRNQHARNVRVEELEVPNPRRSYLGGS